MTRRWILFWGSVLVAVIALGGWRAARADYARETRGIALATREADLPYRLPLPGVNVELTQYADPQAELSQIRDLGFYWVRQPFLWSEIEPQPGEYQWAAYDALVEAVASFDGELQLVAVLDGTPDWARHAEAPEHPFAPPASPAAYGEFARAVAERYGERIDYYQIWDEPNLGGHWGNLPPNPAHYTAMLNFAYDAIHASDPAAMVIMAALAPNVETGPANLNDPAYLRAVYELGGGDYFDAAAGKPYGFDSPPYDRRVELRVMNFSRLILLREEMVRQGDGDKPLWGGNFGWNALPDDWNSTPSIWGQVSAQQQLDYTRAAYQRAYDEWAWVGGLILQHWQPTEPADHPIQGFAIAPRAEAWRGVIPQPEAMPPGLHPATTPYAAYMGDWQFGDLGADAGADAPQNTITIPFEGEEFALRLRRGDYLAYVSVTVDGQKADQLPVNQGDEAFIALTSAERQPTIDLILAAAGLEDGVHTAVITHRPELGDDQWPIVGFAVAGQPPVSRRPQHLALGVMIFAALAALIQAPRLPWRNIRPPSPASLRNLGDFALGLFLSAVVMVGTLLTWHETIALGLRRDLPALVLAFATSSFLYYSPNTWLALVGLLFSGVVIFNRPWIGVLQILFWSAFFTSTLDPFFRAITIVDALLYITLAAALSRAMYDFARAKGRRPRPADIRLHRLDAGMLALLAVGTLALTWSELFSPAFREWRVMLLNPALFYLLIRLCRPSRRELALLVEVLMFTGFMLAAIGIGAYLTGSNIVVTESGARRLLSVYGSPNAVSLMLGRCWPFALAYLLIPVGEWRKILAGVTGVTMLIAVALTQSMGAIFIGLPITFAVVMLAWRGRRALLPLGGLAAAGALALIPLSMALPRLRQVLDVNNSTALVRLNLWRSTAEMLQDYPLTGVGLDQFLYSYRSRYILPEAWEDPNLSHPHNILLDYWVRLGILGVAVAVGLQVLFWRAAFHLYKENRERDKLAFALVVGAMGAMAYSLAHGLVDMAYFNINLSFAFALLMGLIVGLETAPLPTSIKEKDDEFA